MSELRRLLLKHEGLRLKPYLDTERKITIGVGRNLEDVGITSDEAMYLLDKDILRANASAATFSWYPGLDPVRKDVISSMVFNMGLGRFSTFRRMIGAMGVKDFETAASEMLASKWAGQVGRRAAELAEMMRSGVYGYDE